MMQSSYDELSSIDSSTCRYSKHKDEVISAQKTMILSLSDAVNRLACTLQSKEEEIKMERSVRERTESDLESKNLYLMIENAELKNQVADLKDGLSLNHGQQSLTKPPTTSFSSDDWSLNHEDSSQPFDGHLDKEKDSNTPPSDDILKPSKLSRRKSMMNLSNLNITSRFRSSMASTSSRFGTAQSLFTSMKGKKIAWDKHPKLIPRHIYFVTELVPVPVSDNVSDVSA